MRPGGRARCCSGSRIAASGLRRARPAVAAPCPGRWAEVAELADALDLGSSPEESGWGFESPLSHQSRAAFRIPHPEAGVPNRARAAGADRLTVGVPNP